MNNARGQFMTDLSCATSFKLIRKARCHDRTLSANRIAASFPESQKKKKKKKRGGGGGGRGKKRKRNYIF